MSTADASLPQFLVDKRQLAEGESFSFTCHPGVPCFNSCCADVNIILTPIDVLRLARRLGMNTREFLETHGEGMHHIAFRIQGMEEQLTILANKGMPAVQRGDYTGGRYAYVDAVPQLGLILELLENF